MILNIAIPRIHKVTLAMMALMTLLAACVPAEATASEPSSASTATAAPTETATVTVTATPAPTITTAPSPTPTATLSPEEAAAAEKAAIRAEVLSYGINLDDLAHSENEYIRNHPAVATFQEELNNNFGESELAWEMMVVLEVEQLKNLEEYEQAFTTDSGWKFLVWAKVAYKQANGDWTIVNLPMTAYSENTEELWSKMAQNAGPLVYPDASYKAVTRSLNIDNKKYITYLQENFQTYGNFYLDTGAVFRLLTQYPDPEVHLNSGEVGEIPRFTEAELEQFRLIGNPSLFEYQAPDGTYFIWPFVHYASDICNIDYQVP